MMEEDGQSGPFALYGDHGCRREIVRYLLERRCLIHSLRFSDVHSCFGAEAKASSYLSSVLGTLQMLFF